MLADVVDLAGSSTRIASAVTSDESRCEMTIIVRPCAMRAILALTIASLSASSALVASSRMRIARIGDERARDRQPLALPAREIGRALVHDGLVAARQLVDEFLGAGEPRGTHDLVIRRIAAWRQ